MTRTTLNQAARHAANEAVNAGRRRFLKAAAATRRIRGRAAVIRQSAGHITI